MKIVLLGTLLIGWALLGWWFQTATFNLTISYLLVCVGWTSWAYYTAPAVVRPVRRSDHDRLNRENT